MGINCCKETIILDAKPLYKSKNSESILESEFTNFFSLVGPQSIEHNFETLSEKLSRNETKIEKKKILSTKLDFFKNNLDLWVEFVSQKNSSNKLHKYYLEIEYPFTAEFSYLYNFNTNLADVNESLSKFEILNYSIKKDMIILICRSTTKKVLIIQPRNFVMLRVIKRNKNGDFEEYQKSIELTNLRDKEGIKEYLQNFKNLGTIFFNAVRHFKNNKNKWILISSSEVDVLSGTGLMIMKGILKRKIKNYNNKLLIKMTKFLITNRKFDDMIWFTKDIDDIKRIFNENLEIFKKLNVDISKFNIQQQNSFVDWVNEKDTSLNGTEDLNISNILE